MTLFFSQKLHQIGFSLEEGSEVKVHQPWVTNENGYVTRVTGILQSVVVTSDLSYPHLASAASLEVKCQVTKMLTLFFCVTFT